MKEGLPFKRMRSIAPMAASDVRMTIFRTQGSGSDARKRPTNVALGLGLGVPFKMHPARSASVMRSDVSYT